LARIEKERKASSERLRTIKDKIGTIVRAVEAGGDFASLKGRLEELEADRRSLDEELDRLRWESEKVRQHTLSVEVLAESYRDFPQVLDKLIAEGEHEAIKDMIGRYVEVLDWHQDPEDAATGTVDIMLFEQAQDSKQGPADALAGVQARKNPGAPSGELGAPGCNDWLPG
ncbi:MAG: hypothetical protein ACYS22_05580, partial [Planctomycetota bacterium]